VTAASVGMFGAAGGLLLASADLGYQLTGARRLLVINNGVEIGLLLLLSAPLVVMGLLVRRPSNVARVAASVVAGGTALCCCGSVAFAAVAASQQATTDPLTDRVVELQSESVLVNLAFLVAMVLVPLLGTGVLVLLVVPPSSRYYRPAAPTESLFTSYPGYYAYLLPPEEHPPGGQPGR
jgi:hypothetical protein